MTINHPILGKIVSVAAIDVSEYGEICQLHKIVFRGKQYPATLYYGVDFAKAPTLQALVPLEKLISQLDAIDAAARAGVTDQTRLMWLSDRADTSPWFSKKAGQAAIAQLHAIFGNATPAEVTQQQFSAALNLTKLGFSLAPEGSGAAMLTLDYRILPAKLDGEVFAAKFTEQGTLIAVDLES